MAERVWIIAQESLPRWQVQRTRRAFPQAEVVPAFTAQAGWWMTAGAWRPREAGVFPEVDEPTVLLGATLDAQRLLVPNSNWNEVLKGNGGVFRKGDPLPLIDSLSLNPAAAAGVEGATLNEIAAHAVQRGWRVVRHGALDVCLDARPRLLQVITSLQRGGAERLVLDLHQELPRHGVASRVLALGSPTRAPFAAPPDVVQLRLPPDPAVRAAEITRVARLLGADAVHAHLVDGATLAMLDAALPLMVTFHNQRQSWPEGIEKLKARADALLIGCSQVVTREIEEAFPQHVARTIWNGIHAGPAVHAPCGARPLTLVAVANPRPQKRLPLLMDVLAQIPGARLKIAGEPSSIHPEAQEEVRRCRAKLGAHGLEGSVEWLGAVEDVAGLLAETDVFVSTSAHEGLSLAQLEALAAGVPVVATDVGGAAEVAARHPGMMRLLPVDAKAEEFALAIGEMAGRRGEGAFAADFTTRVMAERHAWMLRSLVARGMTVRRGVLLVTNNFSTGGAQSSARRLLLQLRKMGEVVRAVVLQETVDDPTPGRVALTHAGVAVMALEPPEMCDAMRSLVPLLEDISRDPPEAVLLWNVMPEHKVLLADALHGVRLFDVSPGEMLFASLERYFGKPRPGLPYGDAVAYGRRLTGVIVKHESEVGLAAEVFQRKASFVPNGVTVRETQAERAEARWVIGTAARIHPHKRLEDLIEAFRLVLKQLPQARLRIAGGADAGQEAYAEALRQSTPGLPVEWCGELREQELATFHDSLCVFAMISEPAGCPNASLEAMAASLPVVATAVGGATQQVDDGVTGFLTMPRDAQAMADALVRVLEDDGLRAQMRVAARERAMECFSLERMTETYRRVCLGR